MFNQPFDSKTIELFVNSAENLEMDDIMVTIADINGDALALNYSKGSHTYHANRFELSKLYPNPFNPSTEVSFSIPVDNHVKLAAYNVQGQEVDIIFEGAQSSKVKHSYIWNAADFPSGVYYIRLQAGDMVTSQKALLIK